VGRRRRRRERRDASESGPAAPDRRAARADEKRRDAFNAQQRSLRRRRTLIGAAGFIPLVLTLGCGSGLDLPCALPRDVALLIFAGLFGGYLGLTIRLFRERRRFQREAAGGRPA
jgi:hypothetical protein